MAWRDGLGRTKYKTKNRKKKSKIGKFLAVIAILCVVFFVLIATGTVQSVYDSAYTWLHPAAEKIVETKIIEKTVVEPIIIEKTSTETVTIMPEGNWYKYDTSNSDYTPVSDMAALLEQLHLTGRGQAIVEKTKPKFESEAEIVKRDKSFKGTGVIILGLWECREYKGESTEEITVLLPNDELYKRVGSNPKVTLMHELLHSIDYNDDTFDADDFGDELAAMYPEIYKEIKSLGYPTNHINDELFTRVGSEKADAPSAVKKIYALYFEEWGNR
jgi:hypothetical protein